MVQLLFHSAKVCFVLCSWFGIWKGPEEGFNPRFLGASISEYILLEVFLTFYLHFVVRNYKKVKQNQNLIIEE